MVSLWKSQQERAIEAWKLLSTYIGGTCCSRAKYQFRKEYVAQLHADVYIKLLTPLTSESR